MRCSSHHLRHEAAGLLWRRVTFSYDMCSDGRVYQVNCSGSGLPCYCRIMDKGTLKSGNQTTMNLCNVPAADQVETINMVCGWTIQSK